MVFLAPIKKLANALLPEPVLNRYRAMKVRGQERALAGETLQETFSRVYADSLWGSSETGFYSGGGSHDQLLVQPYVSAVRNFVSKLGNGLNAVDLGCGDFNVGKQICDLFASYVACDIVPGLIADNRSRYADLNVDFRVINMASDDLPSGDVVFVRQVLQHLSNADISACLAKLSAYRYAIVSEHVPPTSFKPNVDKPSGRSIRAMFGSGVVLSEPPFSLRPLSEEVLCEVTDVTGALRTTAYRLGQ